MTAEVGEISRAKDAAAGRQRAVEGRLTAQAATIECLQVRRGL